MLTEKFPRIMILKGLVHGHDPAKVLNIQHGGVIWYSIDQEFHTDCEKFPRILRILILSVCAPWAYGHDPAKVQYFQHMA
jgi:hypothetical protein